MITLKSSGRNSTKDKSPKQPGSKPESGMSDEITLRDEILELKRQIMVLKKTNEHNMVKFRKYEDEAKRKDRQIEQLMDPTKNTDIRKILSTKGAAILMSLKDQNNSLIQIILDKDLQIKRLIGEIKMSKLYATSRKTETYRNEITRLRNLLIKSQEMLKEATEVPPTRSVCVGSTPNLDGSTSSSQSSPRELEELRFTIQSLETHMKYSNDLLAKKNQEIMVLNEQLTARYKGRPTSCKKCNKPVPDFEIRTSNDWFIPDHGTRSRSENSLQNDTHIDQVTQKSSNQELLELFEKTLSIHKPKASKSAPSSSTRITENAPRLFIEPQNKQKLLQGLEDLERALSPDLVPKLQKQRSKSLLHDIATDVAQSGTTKQKWKTAVKKIRRNEKKLETKTSDGSENSSEIETHEFEMMEKKIENDQIEIESLLKSTESSNEVTKGSKGSLLRQTNVNSSLDKTLGEELEELPLEKIQTSLKDEETRSRKSSTSSTAEAITSVSSRRSRTSEDVTSQKKDVSKVVPPIPRKRTMLPTSLSEERLNTYSPIPRARRQSLPLGKKLEPTTSPKQVARTEAQVGLLAIETDEIIVTEEEKQKPSDTQSIKEEIASISSVFSPEIRKELQSLYENITSFEEIERKSKLRDVYKQSMDSSFDSENSLSTRNEVKVVEVEVEINQVPGSSGSRSLEVSPREPQKKDGGEAFEDDDDDVVLRYDDGSNDGSQNVESNGLSQGLYSHTGCAEC